MAEQRTVPIAPVMALMGVMMGISFGIYALVGNFIFRDIETANTRITRAMEQIDKRFQAAAELERDHAAQLSTLTGLATAQKESWALIARHVDFDIESHKVELYNIRGINSDHNARIENLERHINGQK